MPADVPKRRNGCTPPYSQAQITAWVCLVVVLLEFVFFVSPLMPLEASIPVTVVFFLLNFIVMYYGALTLLKDPMDVHLARHLKETTAASEQQQQETTTASERKTKKNKHKRKESAFLDMLYNRCNPSTTSDDRPLEEEDMKHCWICDTQVAEHSMHCKFCNKCVSHFDHHCIWLNTCVGGANYKYFFRTIVSIFFMHLSHLVIQLVLLVDSFTGGPTYERAFNWFNAGNATPVHAVLIFFIVFDAISIMLVGQLVWFHILLQRANLSTYQYIVRDHQARRDSTIRSDRLASDRILTLAKAREEKRNFYVFRLRCGGFCRQAGCAVCDPLKLPDPNNDAGGDAEPPGFANSLGAAPKGGSSMSNAAAALNGGGGGARGEDDDRQDAISAAAVLENNNNNSDRRGVMMTGVNGGTTTTTSHNHATNGDNINNNNNNANNNDRERENGSSEYYEAAERHQNDLP